MYFNIYSYSIKEEFKMANIQEMQNKMTIFYSQNTGKIKNIMTGIQNMEVFGEDKEDYNYEFLVLDYDSFVINNYNNFIVENGKIKLINSSISKYI